MIFQTSMITVIDELDEPVGFITSEYLKGEHYHKDHEI